jgi:hypothetical protein
MSNDAGEDASKAAKQNGSDAQNELHGADAGIDSYMSNVNSQIAAGNPYESKDYLTKQNLVTSGAMNSEKDAADAALEHAVTSTGGSSAALAATEADVARQGQRDLTNYTATRDTENEDKWLNQRQGLDKDLLAGADAKAGLYSTATGGQSSDLKTEEEAQAAQDAMWGDITKGAMTGLGSGLGGAFSH